jgi:hypothetical protein
MKILLFLSITLLILSCCETPEPQKATSLTFALTSKKDSTFFKNIKQIYAVGANSSNYFFRQTIIPNSSQIASFQLNLPISYATDSTIYVIENSINPNDTLIVHYKRNLYYKRDKRCGYQQNLTPSVKNHYSTLKKYKLEVVFTGFSSQTGALGIPVGEPYACIINLNEK